jgi:MFS family permease
MQMMAQSWVMSGLTTKAILLGLVNFAAGLPALILAPIAGSLADRVDKRKILVATQIVQIIFAVALGFLVMSGHVRIWHIILFASLLGIAFSYEMPAISALVPELVKREEIAAAVALDRSVFHGSRLIGPSLAGLFVGWWGAASAFFTNALSFVALIAALISLPKRPMGTPEEEEQRRSGILEGFRYVRSQRIIVSLITLIALNTIFVFPAISGDLSDASTLCAGYPPPGCDKHGWTDGDFREWRVPRFDRVTECCARASVKIYDRKRVSDCRRSLSHVDVPGFLADCLRDGGYRHCAVDELWSY